MARCEEGRLNESMVGFTIIICFPSDVPRSKAYVQLSAFIFRRGAAPRLLLHSGIVRVFKHRIGGSPFFPATYIFSYYTGGREKYSAQKFRVPFVRSTLPVILSSRVSSFLSCQIHAHVRIWYPPRARVVQRGCIMVSRLFDVKLYFQLSLEPSRTKGTSGIFLMGKVLTGGNEWNLFLVSVTIIDCTWDRQIYLNGYEKTRKKNAIPHFESF